MVISLIFITVYVMGILTAVRAIMEGRTAQGSVAWAVALITFPWVSVPAFWIFGRSKFKGYILTRKKNLAETNPHARKYMAQLEERGLVAHTGHDEVLLIEHLAQMRFTTGNDAELLIDGPATFQSIFEGISRAKEYVLVEFYIMRDDRLGTELKERLIQKALQGVHVFVLNDEVGSSGYTAVSLAEFRAAGVEIRRFNTRRGPGNRWQINFRNHRKIVIVDGQEAWVGGHNVGDEYMGEDPSIGAWRDTHVKVTGPVVQAVQMAFLEDWHWASQHLLKLHWDPVAAPTGAQRVALALPTGPADELETCTLFFLNAINRAEKRLWLASPYFVPDEQFVSALQLAALRGVEVRILLPDKTDNKLVQLSGWSYVAELEQLGVQIYRYPLGFMHQKVMLIDDVYCTIGTANFDNRSFRLNFEITMAFADTGLASQVQAMLEKDFAASKLVTSEELRSRGFWFRFAVRAARLMAPVQ